MKTRTMIPVLAMAALVSAASGCNKSDATPNKKTVAAQTTTDQSDSVIGGPSLAIADNESGATKAESADIPTEAQAEETAEKTITTKNVNDEVSKLEKEIGQ